MKTIHAVLAVIALSAVLLSGISSEVKAAQLPAPIITASADPFNVNYTAANVFDSNPGSEFATSGNGIGTLFSTDPNNGTWIQFDFGSAVTMDTFIGQTRNNTADVIVESRLYISNDPTFDATDAMIRMYPWQAGWGLIQRFPEQTGRYVRWEAVSRTGTSLNLGSGTMFFLDAPSQTAALPAPVILNSFTPYNASYDAFKAVDGNVTYNGQSEYASLGGVANTYVTFDFGLEVPIAGFDWVNRNGDFITAYNMIFSNDPTFASIVETKSFTSVTNAVQMNCEEFDSVRARYVKFQATATTGYPNTGIADITFYTPSLRGQFDLLSASSEFPMGSRYVASHTMDNQIDGENADWAGVGDGPHTLVFELDQLSQIEGLLWQNRRDSGNPPADYAGLIEVAFSMDGDFTGVPTELVTPALDIVQHSYTFSAHTARYVQLTIYGEGIAGNTGASYIDLLGSPVPEPTGWMLTVVALAALAAGRAIRRR